MGRYNYTRAMERLTVYANKEGYSDIDLDHSNTSYIGWEIRSLNIPKKIGIEGIYKIEYKVYFMLHELGHHVLRKNWNKFSIMLPEVAIAEDRGLNNKEYKYKRRLGYKVGIIEEEFRAWEEGFKLALKLDIRINMDKWNWIKSKCLMGYIRYYS